jgi:hypothetical protein
LYVRENVRQAKRGTKTACTFVASRFVDDFREKRHAVVGRCTGNPRVIHTFSTLAAASRRVTFVLAAWTRPRETRGRLQATLP